MSDVKVIGATPGTAQTNYFAQLMNDFPEQAVNAKFFNIGTVNSHFNLVAQTPSVEYMDLDAALQSLLTTFTIHWSLLEKIEKLLSDNADIPEIWPHRPLRDATIRVMEVGKFQSRPYSED